jgi:hypothetical protein
MSTRFLSRAGLIGVAAGLLGALSALVMLLWPPQVAEDLVSYPFTTVGFYVAQVWFFVHHFGLVLVLVALALSDAVGVGRRGPGGARGCLGGRDRDGGAHLLRASRNPLCRLAN